MRTACIACGRTGAHWTRKAGRDVWRCPACRLLWVPEGLVVDAAGRSIYEEETPIFLQDGNEQYYLDETNLLSCRHKLAWVSAHLPRGSCLLDVGANFGHFLSLARDQYAATGLEVSPAAVKWSREHFGVDNHVGSIYAHPAEIAPPYDAVTLFDVIEHVPDPEGAAAAIARLLAPSGLLFVSTPDARSAVARALGRRWHYLDPVQHIFLFGRENLARVLERAGFDVLEARTFGHHYRLGYVFDRLAYLHHGSALGRAARVAGTALRPVAHRSLYVNAHDVMGLCARRRP
jgi:SAM-dependent methyltransferase